VPDLRPTQIEVYLFRRRGARIQILCLKRAAKRNLPGVWQPVTGKLHRGEGPLPGARREVREETGLVPRRWWALEDVSLYFDAPAGVARVLAKFAAEIAAGASVRLSREHTAFAFLSPRMAGRRFLWEAQRRGLEAVGREVLRGGRLADALEITRHMTRTRGQRRRHWPAPARST